MLTYAVMYRVWRSSLILAFSACYIMWGMLRVLRPVIVFACLIVELIGALYSYHVPCTVASSYRAYEIGYASWSSAGVDDFDYSCG